MSEIFFNERYADFLNAPDETESDALGVLSSLFSQIELARVVNVPGVNVAELLILMAQVEVLFAQYKILKATASELYARYEIEKASFLKNLAASIDQAEPLSSEEAAEMIRIIGVKLLAHRYSLAQLAPAAVIMSIKKSKEFTEAHAQHVRGDLSSYRLVEVTGKENTTRAVATSERMDDHLVETLKTNQDLNVVVVNAPPGSGKTTCLNNLELRLRQEGYEVVQINFDKVIAEFFTLLQKETSLWSKVIAEEFDSSFFNLEQVIKEYYPAEFKNKRVIVLIDTLGYRIDKMNYGLWMIRKLLKSLIEQDRAMVMTIVPQ
ncbi:MAG: AAA-like domain, partial [Patescibacteria group bacterium]|nr:AAA-like domain [Patescibacteria group bacterium]